MSVLIGANGRVEGSDEGGRLIGRLNSGEDREILVEEIRSITFRPKEWLVEIGTATLWVTLPLDRGSAEWVGSLVRDLVEVRR